jgi:Rrf2 family protein
VLLAHYRDKTLTCNELARTFGGSEAHLIKVCQRLARAGFLSARRGPSGGFRIAVDPSQVSLLGVYEAIEGTVEHSHCLIDSHGCASPPERDCVIASRLRGFESSLVEYLARTTIADVAADCPLEVDS